MAEINLSSYETINPRIYAYTIPNYPQNFGWLKIGYTSTQTVEERIKQQTFTARITPKIEWVELSPYCNGKYLIDVDFHKFLTTKKKIPRDEEGREWFQISPELAQKYFYEFSAGKSTKKPQEIISKSYTLREEQINAVDSTLEYFLEEKKPREFLWNAKPRFGKNLAVYELVKQLGAKKILILTNRPSIADSWYNDFKKFTGQNAGNYKFVISKKNPLIKNAEVYSREESLNLFGEENPTEIFFISLQDLKGSKYFGGDTKKLDWLPKLHFDLLVIDESHEGVDTDKSRDAFKNIRRDFTLYLSGTPFKAIANKKFKAEQIFNWSYEDEQNAKINWYKKFDAPNPYADLPRMNLFSYQLSKIFADKISAREDSNYFFSLNDFFETKNGKFIHEDDVKDFLDALTNFDKFPFSTEKLRAELKHTFWLMYRVDGVKAMAKLLQVHPIFKDYKIVIAAGDGKIDEQDEKQNEKSLAKVKAAVAKNPKTITLSVGQLTTGVTVHEWSAVLMLSDFKSAPLYFQTAFRCQNPHRYETPKQIFHKTNCYVFDFSPARTLKIYNEFAQSLNNGESYNGTNILNKLLKVFPVFAENDNGRMVELEAKEIMSLPQKIAAAQVVDSGFMNNSLFKNIDRVFNVSAAVKILNKIRTGDSDKDKIKIGEGEENKPPKIPRSPRPKSNTPPNEIVTEIVKNLADNGYKVSAAQKRKIDELVKQNVDAAEIQETIIKEILAAQNESDIRAKLRTFAATIPSFIMAYGDEFLTLANFDSYIDAETFEQVTGITLAEFRLLRDGGKIDGEFFEGGIFDENIFNEAVQEFLARMEQYADYLDDSNDKDIFDFIPSQKNSQIFTPRFIVQEMLDALEIQNPEIFGNPAQIFFDPYIKSGLYITEIVKRLYRNEKICAAFPDNQKRLKHILENQVYGCAPTEIIFRIAARYIFGNFQNISQKNFHKIDTLTSLQDGNISAVLKNIFSAKVIILNKDRVKKFGEVFTPPDIVNKMLDDENIADVFETLDAKILEPTAGDGAFLVGILQRKLKLAKNSADAFTALSSIYGVEIQLDNLAYARKNLADTFKNLYGDISAEEENIMWAIINANIVQGDALSKKMETYIDAKKKKSATADEVGKPLTFIDWSNMEWKLDSHNLPQIFRYDALTSGGAMTYYDFNFALVIGNPPYQGETSGDNKTFAKPVYHLFLESFWESCNRVMMIHPARCLFNAGATPNAFNKKLLNDEHIKVILYEPNCKNIFPDADIKGGVAVTYRDQNKIFGKIGVYTQFPVLNLLVHDVFTVNKFFKSFNEIMHGQTLYKLSIKAYEDFPALLEPIYTRNDMALRTNAIERFSELFFDKKPNDGNEYIQIWGREDNQRVCMWIRRDYIVDIPELHNYKVFVAAANNVGNLGEKLVTPLVGLPLVGSTQTFISVGDFHTEAEAANCLKYVKTKFARALLGVLKITQHNPPEKWKYVPLQDFTNDSDIDWSRSVAEIDRQLYKKYNLSQEEIDFIESKVKAME